MPGHKRNPKFGITGAEIDITEIDGFDNLHAPTGVIADTEARLAAIYKAKHSFLSVGGSTLGILASLFAVCREGDTVLIARNCHKSVYNACLLLKLKTVLLEPEFDTVNGCYTSLLQDTVDSALSRHPEAAALVFTTPTYEGRISNVRAPIPMIIDAAHGAHLGLADFPAYPKGSIVVSSLHKTLPALTQTAVINVYDEQYISKIKRYLDIFETSSPSYVLMSSVSKCCDIIETHPDYFREYYRHLSDFREITLQNLSLKYSDDISKIIISTEGCDISGSALADLLRTKYAIEPEMASINYIVLMTSVGDEKAAFDRLTAALTKIDATLSPRHITLFKKPPKKEAEFVLSYAAQQAECALTDAVGSVANEFVYAYPPDIPLLSPGETISGEIVHYLLTAYQSGVNIVSDSGLFPNRILTKTQESSIIIPK